MLQIQLTYTANGKKYTFPFEQVTRDVLTEEQIAKIRKIVLKEINKL